MPDALDTCGFMDLGFTSSEFTWQGVRNGQVIWECLDRGVANYDWMAKFPTATIRHLHCISSDHRPLLLLLNPSGELARWKRKPFCYEEMWLADQGCGDSLSGLGHWAGWAHDVQGGYQDKEVQKNTEIME